jgi:hypothetical protein
MRAESIAYLTGAATGGTRPAAVGAKFDRDGQTLPYPGNTFLCHIPPDSDPHAALTEASQSLQAGVLADAFSFLPPASFHMTVFEGITDAQRQPARWPRGVALDAGLDEVTRHLEPRVAHLALPPHQRIRPEGIFGGFSVAVAGATAADERSLRESRGELRTATGIEQVDFEGYRFHITLAYALRWLTAAEADVVMDLSEEVFDRLLDRCPTIDLGGVEFCTFDDMRAFRPRLVIPAR